MLQLESINTVLDWLKQNNRCGTFAYDNPNTSFCKISRDHFKSITPFAGVYVIRHQSSAEILYIGKAGTLKTNGSFKEQMVLERLTNSRGVASANQSFKMLVTEYNAVQVEWVALPPMLAPAYVEAVLLQAFYTEFGKLPPKNKCF